MKNNRVDNIKGGATSPLNSRKVQVNYVRGKIVILLLTESEYDVLNTQSASNWVKGCLVKANLPHMKEMNCHDLLKTLHQYGGDSPHYKSLMNAYLIRGLA